MRTVTKIGFSVAAVLLAGSAFGGSKTTYPVTFTSTGAGHFAVKGIVGTARNSTSGLETIGCRTDVHHPSYFIPATHFVQCSARDATGAVRVCNWQAPPDAVLTAVAGINDDSAINFGVDPAGVCKYIGVDHSSVYSPKVN